MPHNPLRSWVADVQGTKVYQRYREQADRSRRVRAQLLALITTVFSLIYLLWLLPRLDLQVWWLAIPFYLAEVMGLVIFVSFFAMTWYPRYHRPEGASGPLPAYEIDMFITVCGEPLEIVAQTAQAAVALDYPHKTIYLLDDKGHPSIQQLAETLGIQYLARTVHTDAKAGNLNYGLQHSMGELILTLDADQVPQPELLQRLVGYFQYERIAFVQTKQQFQVPTGDPFCNADPVFYSLMQSGKDGDNAAFSCGSGVLYRRQALDEVGGFSTWSLVEDFHTSMRLHARGWRSIYHDHALTLGTAPNEIWGVYKQRRQWATDGMRIFFWDNPWTHRGLSLKQKLQYSHIGLIYLFAGFCMPIFYLIPILSLFTGINVLEASLWLYLTVRLPSFVLTLYSYGVAADPVPFQRVNNTWLGYFPCFIHATLLALTHRTRKPGYKVNQKITDATQPLNQFVGILPQFAIIVLSVLGIGYGFVAQTTSIDLLVINSLWAVWNVERLRWICLAPFAALRDARQARRASTPLRQGSTQRIATP